MKMKHELILLPSKEASIGTVMKYIKLSPMHDDRIDSPIGSLTLNKNCNVTGKNDYWEPYNLYVLSDEKPKEEDWRFNTKTNSLVPPNTKIDGGFSQFDKKISATTDESLLTNSLYGIDSFDSSIFGGEPKQINFPPLFNLPRLSKEFIRYYVEEYNKGNMITIVNVEYNEIYETIIYADVSSYKDETSFTSSLKLKITPDNTINITPIVNNPKDIMDLFYIENDDINGLS
jgi:hypothetical protein